MISTPSHTAADLELMQPLAQGPNSNLYLAVDHLKNSQLVIKEIRSDHSDAQQELLVAHRLRRAGIHPHVITYEAAFVDSDSLFLLMENCSRGDLHSVLEALPKQRLCEREALRIWTQIVLGVQHLHENGIAHRDLSLENVLVDGNENIKICDFGLSALVAPGQLVTNCVGKPYYMAPEILRGEPYDAVVADLWSLGVLLFILLTGSPVVQTATPADPAFRWLAQCGVGSILTHWGMDDDVSARTVVLMGRLLERSPQRRLQSTRGILEFFQKGNLVVADS